MQVTIMTVCKRSEPNIEALIEQYEKRMNSDVQVRWQFMAPSKSSDAMVCRTEESNLILNQLKATDRVVLLDERGQQYDNKGFADTFSRLASSQGRLIFVIGGAYGVSDALRTRADVVWSLSKLVFPHRLIRLVLIEQLYRTVMVVKGHPYHHD